METYTIVTTRASELLAEIHDRMPVVLAKAHYEGWLNANGAAGGLLTPLASDAIKIERREPLERSHKRSSRLLASPP